MNIILGLGIGVIGVVVLMGHITLKHKLNSIEEQNRAINVRIDGQAEKIHGK